MEKIRNLKLFRVLGILFIALVFIGFHLLQGQVKTQGKGKKPKPPPPPPSLLEINDINIATWDDTLRIWHPKTGNFSGFVEQWSKENCDYVTMEFGDANNDGFKDLITTGISTEGKGRNKVYYNYFEVYEHGAASDPSFVSENVPINLWQYNVEARVVDMDKTPETNEIVFMTSAMIKIYRLEVTGETTELASSSYQDDFVFMDLDVVDLDGDQIPEIIVCTQQGFIRIFKFFGDSISVWHDTASVGGPQDYLTLMREVKAVNLDGEGYMEILCSKDDYGESYSPFLLVWKYDKENKFYVLEHEQSKEVLDVDENTHFQFDVGDLEGDGTIEVVLGTYCNSPYDKFEVWRWVDSSSSFEMVYTILSGVSTRTVTVSDADGDANLEVVISGSVYSEGKKDKNLFYLEVFNWNGTSISPGCSLIPLWNFIRTYKTVRHHNVG